MRDHQRNIRVDRKPIIGLRQTIGALAVVAASAGVVYYAPIAKDHAAAVVPAAFLADVPLSCQQLLLVLSPYPRSQEARLWLMERHGVSAWSPVSLSIPVNLGRKGLAWGLGDHTGSAPPQIPIKIEGDGCSPMGLFRLTFVFGNVSAKEAPWVHMPYLPVTDTLAGVDDPRSRYYNQVVDAASVQPDWESHEIMLRPDGLYRWGAMVGHNPACLPGAGSCIFLHLWQGPGQPTEGCTAMAEPDLIRVLAWLDPAKEPRLAQSVEGTVGSE